LARRESPFYADFGGIYRFSHHINGAFAANINGSMLLAWIEGGVRRIRMK
jgi:hypothetical protein